MTIKSSEFAIGDYTGGPSDSLIMTSEARRNMVTLIENIYIKKNYRLETLYLATSICDRYLAKLKISKGSVPDFVLLGVTASLIAAKLEQPNIPNFGKMMRLVNKSWDAKVSIQGMLALENDIVTTLDFSLQHVSPIPFLDRYMRVFNFDQMENNEVATMIGVLAYSFCKVSLRSQIYLTLKPSQVAAAALTLAVSLSTCPIVA